MKYATFLFAAVLAVFILSGCAEPQSRHIQVNATAEVEAAPQLVVFNFKIERRGKVLLTLKNIVDKRTAALVKLCKRLGIKPKDLTAAEVSIEPQYHYNSGRFTGYHVSRNVTARLYDLSKYSSVIDGAVRAGITTIENVSLQIKEEYKLENEALAKAVLLGTSKARMLAEQNGVRLGKVIQITETGSVAYQANYELRRKGLRSYDAASVFEPGRLSVSKSIQLTFEII